MTKTTKRKNTKVKSSKKTKGTRTAVKTKKRARRTPAVPVVTTTTALPGEGFEYKSEEDGSGSF